MNISPAQILKIPLHDALILDLNVAPAADGVVVVTLRVQLNPEEPLTSVRPLGITSPTLDLVFGKCWQAEINVLGYATGPEVISTFEIEEESTLIQNLRSSGLGGKEMVHFQIEGSHGSKLGIVAEFVSINQRT